MEYITLKNSDLKVSRLCMGGCPMGGYGWGNVQEQELIDALSETKERMLLLQLNSASVPVTERRSMITALSG